MKNRDRGRGGGQLKISARFANAKITFLFLGLLIGATLLLLGISPFPTACGLTDPCQVDQSSSDAEDSIGSLEVPVRLSLRFLKSPELDWVVGLELTVEPGVDAEESEVIFEIPDQFEIVIPPRLPRRELKAGKKETYLIYVRRVGREEAKLSAFLKVKSGDFTFGKRAYIFVGEEAGQVYVEPNPRKPPAQAEEIFALAEQPEPEQQPSLRLEEGDATIKHDDPLEVKEFHTLGPGEIVVWGYWNYYDKNGTKRALRKARVEIWDADPLFLDDLLDTVRTDNFGFYQSKVLSNSDGLGQGTQDIYTKVFATDDKSVKVTNFSGGLYFAKYPVPEMSNVPDGGVYVGSPGITGTKRAVFFIHDKVANDAYDYLRNKVGWTNNYNLPIRWDPDNYTHGTHYDPGGSIHLGRGDGWDLDITLKMYSHFVMYKVYGNKMPSVTNCSSPSWSAPSSLGCAWVHGWAIFLQAAIQNDRYFTGTDDAVFSLDLEGPSSSASGAAVMGAVAASLWDMFDCRSEGWDSVCLDINGPSGRGIWDATKIQPDDVQHFYGLWYNRTPSYHWQVTKIFDHHRVLGPPETPVLRAPPHLQEDVSLTPTLDWDTALGATQYDVYLGKTNPPPFVATVQMPSTRYDAGPLDPGWGYYWNIKAANSSSVGFLPAPRWFKTGAPPPAPTNLNPPNGQTDVSLNPTLSWSGSAGSSYDVYFGWDGGWGDCRSDPPFIINRTAPSLTVGSLGYSTGYCWRVVARNSFGGSSTIKHHFTTVPDTTRPVISGVACSNITPGGMTITWTTDELSTSQVEYGPTTAYGNLTPKDPADSDPRVTTHRVILSSLTADTLYHYKVKSQDAADPPNLGESGDNTCTTDPLSLPPLERISVDSNGAEASGASGHPAASADGRFIAFVSDAGDLVPEDTNGVADIFVRDRQTGGETKRVSVSSDGAESDGESSEPAISADGRFVGFASAASNLVPEDNNDVVDVFVHNRETGQTELVSVASDGTQGDGISAWPTLSVDGRLVAFYSEATNLIEGDTNGVADIFVHDRQSGVTKRVSVSSDDVESDGPSWIPAISADGGSVVFASRATNLVATDTNGADDIFVHDLQSGETTRVSVTGDTEANGRSGESSASISADGQFAAFDSLADNLVTLDTNGFSDIFVHDRQTGVTKRVSVDSFGTQADDASAWPAISADGRFVVFASDAGNLVPGVSGTSIFLHDRQSGQTTLMAESGLPQPGVEFSLKSDISADGRFAGLTSRENDLVPGDNNGVRDVFVAETGLVGAPVVVTAELPDGRAGITYSHTLQAIGGTPPYTWAVVIGSLPQGLDLNPSTGEIFGTPDAGVKGKFDFTVRASDSANPVQSGERALSIAVNTPPVAQDDAFSLDEDSTLDVAAPGVLANDTDVDGDPLTAILASGPTNGSLIITLNSDGSFTYVPNDNFNGTDSFTYKANDGTADSNEATVTLTINPVNDAPVANAGAYESVTGTSNSGESVTLDGSASPDPDVDGDTLTYTWAGPFGTVTGVNPTVTMPLGTSTVTLAVNDGKVDPPVDPASCVPAEDSCDTADITVTDFTVSASPAPPESRTVSAGQSASYTITVSPKDGPYDSAVSLTCSDLPPKATCSFSLSSVTPGGSDVTLTLTINTTAASSVVPYPTAPLSAPPPLWVFWLATALGLLAALYCVRRPVGSFARVRVAVGLVTLILFFQIGCGGGGSTPPPPIPGTPPGTYTITVTGTADSLTDKTPVKLVVQ